MDDQTADEGGGSKRYKEDELSEPYGCSVTDASDDVISVERGGLGSPIPLPGYVFPCSSR